MTPPTGGSPPALLMALYLPDAKVLIHALRKDSGGFARFPGLAWIHQAAFR